MEVSSTARVGIFSLTGFYDLTLRPMSGLGDPSSQTLECNLTNSSEPTFVPHYLNGAVNHLTLNFTTIGNKTPSNVISERPNQY
ncbi:hypothetical protein FQN49_007034 [Arthroderma sp. PD_2]|nr:hypothetical protein FQN49_007034 [Arthroderma sp. PD_2]